MPLSAFPTLNACLNATSALLILLGWRFIRRREIPAHKACMVGATIVSLFFLAGYLYYHAHAGTTKFAGTGLARPVYFSILVTHTVLAMLLPVLVPITLGLALRGRFERHRRLARWTFPIWLYVSVTGVIVYLMLYHFYPSR